MNRKRKKLSAGELEIMKQVWELEQATVSEILELLNQKRPHAPVSRNALQIQLQRIEDKGWLKHRQRKRSFVYIPKIGKEAGLEEITHDFRNQVFDGSGMEMIRCLVNSEKILPEEIEELKRIVKRAAKNATK